MTGETLSIDGRSYPFSYSYDTGGNLSSETDPSGTAFTFAPDGFGRPTKAAVGGTNHIGSVVYQPNGLVASASFANGQALTQSLTARQLPYEIKTAKSGGATAMDLVYGYSDPRRVVTSVTDNVLSGNNRAYSYDADGRLLTASGPWGSGGYSYDALDNLWLTTLGSRTITTTYNATTNRVNQVTDTAGGGTRTYAYDASGNTASDGLRTFTHDAADQPVTVVQGGTSAGYTYDGNLHRVKSVVGANTVYTVYSHASSLVYRDQATAGTHTSYIDIGPAELRLVNGVATYTHADNLGSPVAATDASGAVAWQEKYTPFGEGLNNPAGNSNDKNFTGYLKDSQFALLYAEARDYDPAIGRFLEPDPMREADQISLYAYVGNDPADKTDPSGEITVLCAGAASADGKSITWTCGSSSDLDGSKYTNLRVSFDDKVIATGRFTGDFTKDESTRFAVNAYTKSVYEDFANSPAVTVLDRGVRGDNQRAREHANQRGEQARQGDTSRQVGDRNRVVREGRPFRDSETGYDVYVDGDRVVINKPDGTPVTQFTNARANTQQRIQSGKWVPK